MGRGAEPFISIPRNIGLITELIKTGHDVPLPGYGKMDDDELDK